MSIISNAAPLILGDFHLRILVAARELFKVLLRTSIIEL